LLHCTKRAGSITRPIKGGHGSLIKVAMGRSKRWPWVAQKALYYVTAARPGRSGEQVLSCPSVHWFAEDTRKRKLPRPLSQSAKPLFSWIISRIFPILGLGSAAKSVYPLDDVLLLCLFVAPGGAETFVDRDS
jgi:hypothetical protein